MADTMTLEALRTYLADMEPEDVAVINAALDAAIRERDELRERALNLATGLQEWQALHAEQETRAEKAAAELAALRARILPGAAKVEIIDANDPDGNPYGWVGDTLLPHNLIGKRVRLIVEADDV